MIHFFRDNDIHGYTYNDNPNVRTFVFQNEKLIASQYNRNSVQPEMEFEVNGKTRHLTTNYSLQDFVCNFYLDGEPADYLIEPDYNNEPITVATYPRSGKFWLQSLIMPYIGMSGYNVLPESILHDTAHTNIMSLVSKSLSTDKLFQPNANEFSISHLAYERGHKLRGKKVFLMRDPRDQVVSNALFHGGAKLYIDGEKSFDADGLYWQFINGNNEFCDIVTSCKQQLDWYTDPSVYTLTYEQLTNNPAIAIRTLLRYLEIDVDIFPVPLETVIDANSFKSVTGRERGDEIIRYHRKGSVGDYKEKLSPEVLGEIESRAGKYIRMFGY